MTETGAAGEATRIQVVNEQQRIFGGEAWEWFTRKFFAMGVDGYTDISFDELSYSPEQFKAFERALAGNPLLKAQAEAHFGGTIVFDDSTDDGIFYLEREIRIVPTEAAVDGAIEVRRPVQEAIAETLEPEVEAEPMDLSFLDDPSLSLEEKLMRFFAEMIDSQDPKIEALMDKANKNRGENGQPDQLVMTEIQQMMNKRSQMATFVSNFMQTNHQTVMAFVNNIRA